MSNLLEQRAEALKEKPWYRPMTDEITGLLKEWLTSGEWFKTRPKEIQELILQYPPWYLYGLTSGQQVVVLNGYTESNEKHGLALSVHVVEEYNSPLGHEERTVFGVPPEDLKPICVNPIMVERFEETSGKEN